MKVQGPSSSTSAVGAKRTGGLVAPGFVLPSDGLGAAASVSRTAPTAGLTNIGALLALQSEDDVTERRRRAARRSNSLLDQLDSIRLAILDGGVTREQVSALATTLREHRDAVDDPGLNAILDDVELRAEVELAKLERAL
jgi:Class II flagellar assembly regulator